MPWRVNADDVIHSFFRSEEREESPINMPEATAAAPPPESILSDQIPHPDNDAITATNDAIDNNNEKALLQQQELQQDSMVVLGSEAAYEITQDQLQDLLNQGILSSVPESAVATVTAAAATAAVDVMQECEDEIEAEAIEPPHEANNQPQAEAASPRRYSRRACRRSGPDNATVFEVHIYIFPIKSNH